MKTDSEKTMSEIENELDMNIIGHVVIRKYIVGEGMYLDNLEVKTKDEAIALLMDEYSAVIQEKTKIIVELNNYKSMSIWNFIKTKLKSNRNENR